MKKKLINGNILKYAPNIIIHFKFITRFKNSNIGDIPGVALKKINS